MTVLEGPKKGFVIIDYVLLILAVFGNCFVLDSVSKIRFSLTGYRHFLLSLLCSDLFLCGVNLMNFVYQGLNPDRRSSAAMYTTSNQLADIIRSLQVTGFVGGMSVDHYVGIINPLRYNQVLSKRYVRFALALIWLFSFSFGFADLIVSIMIEVVVNSSNSVTTSASLEMDSNLVIGSNQSFSSLHLLLGVLKQHNRIGTSVSITPELPFEPYSLTTVFPDQLPPSDTLLDLPDGEGTVVDNDIRTLERLLWNIVAATNQTTVTPSFDAMFDMNESSSSDPRLNQIMEARKRKLEQNYSTRTHKSVWVESAVMLLTLFCFAFLVFCYGRIFKEVSFKFSSSGANARRIVMTTCLMLGAFAFCWLPFMSFELIMMLRSEAETSVQAASSFIIVHHVFNTVLMASPLVDPIIYAWRMRVVRRYIVKKYFRCLPCVADHAERIAFPQNVSVGSVGAYRGSLGGNNGNNFYYRAGRNLLNSPNVKRENKLLKATSDTIFNRKGLFSRSDKNKGNGTQRKNIKNGAIFRSFDLTSVCQYIDDSDSDDFTVLRTQHHNDLVAARQATADDVANNMTQRPISLLTHPLFLKSDGDEANCNNFHQMETLPD